MTFGAGTAILLTRIAGDFTNVGAKTNAKINNSFMALSFKVYDCFSVILIG